MRVGDVIVRGPVADRDALVQLVAAIERLAELQQVAVALQLDVELLAHPAAAAVAADQVVGGDVERAAVELGGLWR